MNGNVDWETPFLMNDSHHSATQDSMISTRL